MARISAILQQLRTLMATQRADGQTDAYLLDQHVSQRDEVAFAALLERHGPMVLGVCRRILHDEHRTEDAFQATFLVLVRKASSIRKQQSIASWLHGVALRLARKARTEAIRATRPDARGRSQEVVDVQTEASWNESQEILDDELQRLPENYRLPLVLCYLEGLTRDEAAAQLGWSANKLRGYLERGRNRLRFQLLRRGVTLSAAGSATLMADTILAAAVPPLLTVATIQAAARLAAGTALTACGVSGPVVALTQGGLKMMASKKLSLILALVLFTAVLGSGVGIFGQRTEPREASQPNEPIGLAIGQDLPKDEKPKEGRVDRFGDPLPDGAIARLGTMRFRHPFWVSGLAYTPDEKILASACWDGTVRLWEAETGKESRRFRCEPNPNQLGQVAFTAIAITPDGKSLIALENHDLVHVWDLASGKERWQLKGGNGFALALSADGKTVAKGLGGGDKKKQLSLWDLETGQPIRTLGASSRSIPALAFSRDGKLLAAGDGYPVGQMDEKAGTDSSVWLWDPTNGRLLREFKGHTGGVTAVAFSPDGKLLASASHDATIRLWSPDGQLVRNIAVPEERYPGNDRDPRRKKGIQFGGVLAVAFSPDGRTIASGGFDGCVRLWDAITGKELHTLVGHGREVVSVVFSRNGKVLASGSRDYTIRLWDPANGMELQPRPGHNGAVQAIAVSPDGKWAAAACRDRSIHVWSLDSGQRLHVLRGHTESIFSVAFSPDGRHLASASMDDTIRIWDPLKGCEVRRLLGHKGGVYSVAFTPVEKMLLSVGRDSTLRFWDWSSGKEHRQIKTERVGSRLSLSRDGRIVGIDGAQPRLWEVATGKEMRRVVGGPDLALAPDGRTFVTPGSDGMLGHWNVATGELQLAYHGPTLTAGWAGAPSLVFSFDGRLVAARDGTGIGLWEVATGKVRRHVTGHQGSVVPFVFSPDGRTLLTGSEDTTILIWDLARQHESRPVRLAPSDLESLWRDLGGGDAERADRAICTLTARADQSVPFLNKHLGPIKAPDPKRLSALISGLDSDAFSVRDEAVKELQGMRELAMPALKEARARPGPLETRRRIEDLLAKQRTVLTAGDLLQSLRAVEVLEGIDNFDARKLLQKLATGASHARLTQEARDAVSRLDRRLAK